MDLVSLGHSGLSGSPGPQSFWSRKQQAHKVHFVEVTLNIRDAVWQKCLVEESSGCVFVGLEPLLDLLVRGLATKCLKLIVHTTGFPNVFWGWLEDH